MKNLFFFLLLLTLCACGGGGGGSSTSTSNKNPFVIAAATSAKAGSYGIGSEIEIKIEFKEEVAVGSINTIKVTLNCGSDIIFTNVSGTSATAMYIVKEGDNIDDLKILSITLEGDLVKQAGGSFFTTIPVNINSDKVILVDTIKPNITEFSSLMADGFYNLGDTINLTIKFDEIITLNGTITVSLNNGAVIIIPSFTGKEADFSFAIAANMDVEQLVITTITLEGEASDSAGNLLLLDMPAKNLEVSNHIQIDFLFSFLSIMIDE